MKNGQENESVEIELNINPSFRPSLKIRAKKGSIYYQGNPHGSFFDTIENTITISESDFNDLIKDIKTLHVFSIPEFAMGLDGTTYTIRIENGWNSVTYNWWGECPKEWEQLGKLAEKLVDFTRKYNVMSPE